MRSLVIGGTRNLGPSIVHALLQREHDVAVFIAARHAMICRKKLNGCAVIGQILSN